MKSYSLGDYITVYEMLEAFHCRCKFREYINNKAAKYHVKMNGVVDSKMFYTHNLDIYAGKQLDGPYKQPNDPK